MKSEQISLLHHSGQQKARVRTPNPNKWLGWAAEFLCHTCLLWASHIFMGKQFYPDTSPITVSIVAPPDNRAAVNCGVVPTGVEKRKHPEWNHFRAVCTHTFPGTLEPSPV